MLAAFCCMCVRLSVWVCKVPCVCSWGQLRTSECECMSWPWSPLPPFWHFASNYALEGWLDERGLRGACLRKPARSSDLLRFISEVWDWEDQPAPLGGKVAATWEREASQPLGSAGAFHLQDSLRSKPFPPVFPSSQASTVAKREDPKGPTSWQHSQDSCAKRHQEWRGGNSPSETGCRGRWGRRRGSPEEGLKGELQPFLMESPAHAAGSGSGEQTQPGQGPLQ